MRIVTCPNCSKEINFDDSREFVFCAYCGSKVLNPDKVDVIDNLISDKATTSRKPLSPLSLIAFILSFTLYFSAVGLVLGIIDKKKGNPQRRHSFTTAAICIGAILTVCFLIIMIPSFGKQFDLEDDNVDVETVELEETSESSVETETITAETNVEISRKPTPVPPEPTPVETTSEITVNSTHSPSPSPTPTPTPSPTPTPTPIPTPTPTPRPTATPTPSPQPASATSSFVLPPADLKISRDYAFATTNIIYYINVDGTTNIPSLTTWNSVTVTDSVAEYLNYLENLGYDVEVTSSDTRNPYPGYMFYESYYTVTGDGISWTMYVGIDDEDYVEYELDIYKP